MIYRTATTNPEVDEVAMVCQVPHTLSSEEGLEKACRVFRLVLGGQVQPEGDRWKDAVVEPAGGWTAGPTDEKGAAALITPAGQVVGFLTANRARGIAAALNTSEGADAFNKGRLGI